MREICQWLKMVCTRIWLGVGSHECSRCLRLLDRSVIEPLEFVLLVGCFFLLHLRSHLCNHLVQLVFFLALLLRQVGLAIMFTLRNLLLASELFRCLVILLLCPGFGNLVLLHVFLAGAALSRCLGELCLTLMLTQLVLVRERIEIHRNAKQLVSSPFLGFRHTRKSEQAPSLPEFSPVQIVNTEYRTRCVLTISTNPRNETSLGFVVDRSVGFSNRPDSIGDSLDILRCNSNAWRREWAYRSLAYT